MTVSVKTIPPHLQVKVFVSYARADTGVRTTFISKLGDAAIDQVTHFWIDDQSDLGCNWEDLLKEQLRTSAIILLIVTKSFLQSRYCMEQELPLAVELHRSGSARVVFVRMTNEPVTSTLLEELLPWPPSGSLGQGKSDPAKEIAAFRAELKKRVVEELKKSKDLGGEPNLWYLHSAYGVPEPQRRRRTKWLPIASVLGIFFGWAAGSVLLPHLPNGLLRPIILFSVLDGGAKAISLVPRLAEVWRKFFKDQKTVAIKACILFCLLEFSAGLLHGALYGLVLGLVFGALRGSLGRWQAAVVGALLANVEAFGSLSDTSQKYLQIFLDVGDRTRGDLPRKTSPWSDWSGPEATRSPAERVPVTTMSSAEDPNQTAEAGPEAEASGTAGDGLPKQQRLPVSSESYWRRRKEWTDRQRSRSGQSIHLKEDVALRTLILYASADFADYESLRWAMTRVGVDDMCDIETVVSGSAGTEESEYWSLKLAELDILVVLMSAAFVDTQVNRAISTALTLPGAQTPGMTPVLLENIAVDSSEIMSFQGWPSPPVREWPVRRNAWLAVVSEIRKQFLREFQERLNFLRERRWLSTWLSALERLNVELAQAKPKRAKRLEERRNRVLHSSDDLDYHAYFDWMRKYPYRHFQWNFRVRQAALWVVLAATVSAKAHGMSTRPLSAALYSGIALALALAGIAVWRETKLRMTNPAARDGAPGLYSSPPIFMALLIGETRRKLLLAACPAALCALAGVGTAWIWAPGWPSWMIGGFIGLVAYLLTSNRVPRLLIERRTPKPGDLGFSFQQWGLSVEAPQTYDAWRSGNIGPIRAVDPEVMKGWRPLKLRFSLRVAVKSLRQSFVVLLLSFLVALLFKRWLGATSFWSVTIAAIVSEIAQAWLGHVRVIDDLCFWQAGWEGTLQMVLFPVANGCLCGLVFVAVYRFAGMDHSARGMLANFLLVLAVFTFFRRLRHNIIRA